MTKRTSSKGRAVFLDRDGTINVEAEYLADPDKLELFPGSAEAIRLIREMGFMTIVVSNQSGVSRGYFSEETVMSVNRRLSELLAAKGASVDAFYYCPHHPEIGDDKYRIKCLCRKPATGMVDRAGVELDIETSKSYMIGDKLADIKLAVNSNMKGILVTTGYGEETLAAIEKGGIPWPSHVAKNLLDAALWIKKEEENKKIM